MTTLPPLTYLTFDSLREGVGASQVLAYVERLAGRGVDVRLHSFEKTPASPQLAADLNARGVTWTPHPFGAEGARAGLGRVGRGARAVRGAELVHARSDLPAASALIARSRNWVWDIRALWADQRIALGTLREGDPEHRVLQRIERAAAHRSTAVITLTKAVLPILETRHGGVAAKASVVPTCVDLARFQLAPMPPAPPIRVLLAGTLNTYYDVATMLRLVEVGGRRGEAQLELLTPGPTPWDSAFAMLHARRGTANPASMPDHLTRSHIGLSVCRPNAGVSLTAAMPTKIAEFLAVGRPVVVNAGLGDAEDLLEGSGTAVILRDLSDDGLERAWEEIRALVDDPQTPQRCRALAEQHFDLDRATDTLLSVYQRVVQSR